MTTVTEYFSEIPTGSEFYFSSEADGKVFIKVGPSYFAEIVDGSVVHGDSRYNYPSGYIVLDTHPIEVTREIFHEATLKYEKLRASRAEVAAAKDHEELRISGKDHAVVGPRNNVRPRPLQATVFIKDGTQVVWGATNVVGFRLLPLANACEDEIESMYTNCLRITTADGASIFLASVHLDQLAVAANMIAERMNGEADTSVHIPTHSGVAIGSTLRDSISKLYSSAYSAAVRAAHRELYRKGVRVDIAVVDHWYNDSTDRPADIRPLRTQEEIDAYAEVLLNRDV